MSRTNPTQKQGWNVFCILACCALFGMWMMHVVDNYKVITILAAAAVAIFFLTLDIRPLKRLPALLLCGYVLYSGLSGLWAISGKFYLREYSKILIAFAFFLAIAMRKEMSERWVRRIMELVAGTAAIFSALSVEAAATGLTQMILKSNEALSGLGMQFSDRLVGILGNANMLSSILGVGIFASLALLCGAENDRQKDIYAVLLAINAFSFLLAFSMGGTFCFAVAIVCYLIFAGKQRTSVLLRMLEGAIPTLIWGGLASQLFNRGGVWNLLPLAMLVLNCATVVLLERKAALGLSEWLQRRQKLTVVLLVSVAVLGIAYVVAGYFLSGPFTFQENVSLRRSAYPESGVHTLSIEADGDVNVVVISQNMSEVMMHTNTVLYSGKADQAQFTVPDGTEVCYFTFTAAEGTTIHEASIDGTQDIRLNYLLLPDFIADRIQGLWANQNAIQRTVFFVDGMKIFRQHPVLGSGVGAFETALTSVQDFYYVTRYVHNHYIQILLENGLPGLLLFAGGLLSLAVLLWRRRRDQDGSALSWAYPALWAALTMVAAHSAVEVSMSNITFLTYAYTIFGLILVVCPEKEAEPQQAEQPVRKKKGKDVQKNVRPNGVRWVCAAFPIVFAFTICLNIVARTIATAPVANVDDAFSQFERAATIDPYEGNDAKLSYVITAVDELTPARQEQADKYAAQLMECQSNSIPQSLVYYYLSTGQYSMAVQAAEKGAIYSASDSAIWTNIIEQLNTQFTAIDTQALQGEEGEALLAQLLDYYHTLQERNQSSMDTIALTESNKNFFSKLLNLEQGEGETIESLSSLLFRSWLSCDADNDGVSDQIAMLEDASVGENGAISLQAEGKIGITVDISNSMIAQVTVECDDPAAVTIFDQQTGEWLPPDTAENGQAVFPVILYGTTDSDAYTFELSTAASQTFSRIEIVNEVTE